MSQHTLNLGSGRKRLQGAVNLDLVAETNPDVVHDLNRVPWPFEDNVFREIVANDVIEHLGDIVQTMEEIHRICAPGAIVKITVPHFSCANAFTDPTHRHYFSYFSFDYFTGAHDFSFYSNARYQRISASLIFDPTWINKIVWRLARRNPARYERRWAWVFPAWFLYFELQVIKPAQPAVS